MTKREWVDEYSDEFVQDDDSNGLLVMDGYDDCIVGIAERLSNEGPLQFVVYDRNKVLAKLMKDGMSHEEALDYHLFNQVGGYYGPHTVAFIDLPPAEATDA